MHIIFKQKEGAHGQRGLKIGGGGVYRQEVGLHW